MRRVKTIDELYDEVKGFDVVLCNDLSLMTALNNRVDRPYIGNFALTPSRIAKKKAIEMLGETPWDDLKVISTIADLTGYDIKLVHGEVENIRTIRRYTEKVEKHLFGRSKRIYREYKDLPTEDKVMSMYDVEKDGLFMGRNVAVIALDLFNDLDKHFIPNGHTEIDIFTDDEYTIERIYTSGNDRNMADNAVDLITKENATDFAIVIDSGSHVADAVRSALYRKGIPFKNELLARDLIQVRDYIELLELSLSYDTVRVGQVRELFSSCGAQISLEYDDYLLSSLESGLDERSRRIREMMRNINKTTFIEVCDTAIADPKRNPMYGSPIKTLLNSMEIGHENVTGDRVSTLSYAVNNMELPHNEEIPNDEKDGVLITDCMNSVFVDRPSVIFLGMGQDWYRPPQGKRYIDWEDERERNVMRFQALLQQGSSRIYMANAMRNGKATRPCVLFDDILGRNVKTFSEIAELDRGGWYDAESTISIQRTPIEHEHMDSLFTKSSFNEYVMCPRRFMFSKLIKMPGRSYNIFGNLVHEFAEFCMCYPSLVEENGIDHYVELMMERYSGATNDESRNIDMGRMYAALTNIRHFISSMDIRVPLDREGTENPLMIHHGLNMTSSMTESRVRSERTPLYGIFDLLVDGMIVDYKTGRQKDTKTMKKDMGTGPSVKYAEFQPIVYLTILDDISQGKKLFRIFNVLGNPEDAIMGSPNLDGCFVDISVSDMDFEDFVKEDLGQMMTERYGIGQWGQVADRLIELGPPDPASKWIDDKALLKRLETANNGKGSKKILDQMAKAVSGWAVDTGDSLEIFRWKLDEFRTLVKDEHRKMMNQRESGFPGDLRRCDDCSYFSVCTIGGMDDDGPE